MNEKKPNEIKQSVKVVIADKPIKVLETEWTPESTATENDQLKLKCRLDCHITKPSDVLLYKDQEKCVVPSDKVKIEINNAVDSDGKPYCELTMILTDLKPDDTGKYRLCMKNQRRDLLGSTSLQVKPKESEEQKPEEQKPDEKQTEEEPKAEEQPAEENKLEELKPDESKTEETKPEEQKTDEQKVEEQKTEEQPIEEKPDSDDQQKKQEPKQEEQVPEEGIIEQEQVQAKPEESKPKQIEAVESNWNPETKLTQGEIMDLSVKINKPIDDQSNIKLLKNGKIVDLKDGLIVENNGPEECSITIKKVDSQPMDSGNYELVVEETVVAKTKVTVTEVPIEVTEPMKASQEEYKEGEDIELTFTLNKPLANTENCVQLLLNKKPIDIKLKQIQLIESDKSQTPVSYTFVIKKAEAGKNDGEYTVKLRAKPDDQKSEFYSGSAIVKIKENQKAKVIESNWQPEVKATESHEIELSLKIDKLIDISQLVLNKNNKKMPLNEAESVSLKIENCEDGQPAACQIKLTLSQVSPSDAGNYKLSVVETLKGAQVETELGKTKVVVEEKPAEIIEPFKSDKDEYNEGEDISLTFTLSKPLIDKEKCITLTLNKKPVDLKAKNVELKEEKSADNQVTYVIKIKSCEIGKNDGEYSIALKSKPTDQKAELYTATTTIKIKSDKTEVLESNWSPETILKEAETLDLFVNINKPLEDVKSLSLYKDGKKVSVPALELERDQESTQIKLKIEKVGPNDAGKYKLTLAESVKGKPVETELGVTSLKVEEKPFEVIKELHTLKEEYKESEEVSVVFILNKSLPDTDKCVSLLLDNKPVDLKSKNVKVLVDKEKQVNQVEYTIQVGSIEAIKSELEFTVKLKSKPTDLKSEFYSGKVVVKIKLAKTEVLDSNWKPETNINETENLELELKLNKPVTDLKSVVIYKYGKKLPVNDHIKLDVTNGDEEAVIKLSLNQSTPADSGDYKLVLVETIKNKPVETELGKTKLTVTEKPYEIVQPFQSDKEEYKEGESITLSFTLSKSVVDKDKCVTLTLNGKPVDLKAKNVEFTADTSKPDQVTYTFVIKASEIGKNDGEYNVKVRSKPTDQKSEFLNEKAVVKIKSDKTEVLDSNWKPELKLKEKEELSLFVTINKPLEDKKNIILYKDGKKIPLDGVEIEENTKITLVKAESLPTDSGTYRLVLVEQVKNKPVELELGKTSLVVEESPIEVVGEFKANKEEYKEGETIELSFTLSKPLSDKDKCVTLSLNNKPIDLKSKSVEYTVTDNKSDGVVYNFVIKASEVGKNDGEFTLKLRSKPADQKSEFYTAKCTVKIKSDKTEVLESNWKPEYKINENEELHLFVVINKPVDTIDNVLVYKDGKKLTPNEHLTLAVDNVDGQCRIKLDLTKSSPTDSGAYKLCLIEKPSGKPTELELGKTKLVVEESPIEVVVPLKASKDEYQVGEEIRLTFTLSKPLANKDKCQSWSLNGKPVDLKSKRIQIEEIEDKEKQVFVYNFVVKACEAGVDDGKYVVKLKPTENAKQEFYSADVEVKIVVDEKKETPDKLQVLESNWPVECVAFETESKEFYVVINQPLGDGKSLIIYKDNKKLAPSVENIKLSIESTEPDKCKIIVKFDKLKKPDSGSFKLVLAESKDSSKPATETELAKTSLTVKEHKIEVLEPLKSDKEKYEIGEDIHLSFTLSMPLSDKLKCQQWTLNGKPFDLKPHEIIEQRDDSSNSVSYTLLIKSCEKGKHDGEFTLKLRSKPDSPTSEFYSAKINIKIEKPSADELTIIKNIQVKPNNQPSVNETVTFIVVLSRLPNDKDSEPPLAWLKNGAPLSQKPTCDYVKEENNYEVKLVIDKVTLKDSGVYSLRVNDVLSSGKVELNVVDKKKEGIKFKQYF